MAVLLRLADFYQFTAYSCVSNFSLARLVNSSFLVLGSFLLVLLCHGNFLPYC